jgi:hypothetical protein
MEITCFMNLELIKINFKLLDLLELYINNLAFHSLTNSIVLVRDTR